MNNKLKNVLIIILAIVIVGLISTYFLVLKKDCKCSNDDNSSNNIVSTDCEQNTVGTSNDYHSFSVHTYGESGDVISASVMGEDIVRKTALEYTATNDSSGKIKIGGKQIDFAFSKDEKYYVIDDVYFVLSTLGQCSKSYTPYDKNGNALKIVDAKSGKSMELNTNNFEIGQNGEILVYAEKEDSCGSGNFELFKANITIENNTVKVNFVS